MTKVRSVRFTGSNGRSLAGRLDLPPGEPVAWALLAHCFTCSKDYKGVRRISSALARSGFGALAFDFTGLGESEGAFDETTFSSNLEDLAAAAAYLQREHGPAALMVGHSLGGAAVLAAADRIAGLRAVVTIAAPSDTLLLARKLSAAADRGPGREEIVVPIGARLVRIGRPLIDDLRVQNLHEKVAALPVPLLLCHSPRDAVVGIEHAQKLYRLAPHPKSFLSLGGADHLLAEDPADATWVGEVIAAWARRYL
jgi:putative redox protein